MKKPAYLLFLSTVFLSSFSLFLIKNDLKNKNKKYELKEVTGIVLAKFEGPKYSYLQDDKKMTDYFDYNGLINIYDEDLKREQFIYFKDKRFLDIFYIGDKINLYRKFDGKSYVYDVVLNKFERKEY